VIDLVNTRRLIRAQNSVKKNKRHRFWRCGCEWLHCCELSLSLEDPSKLDAHHSH
jgi:hypothetical protein